MTPERSEFAASSTKAGVAWAGVLAGSSNIDWALLASKLAVAYTALLIAEWVWKKLWKALLRPCAVRKGWVKPKAVEFPKDDPYGL